jgi:hypothetical protein
VAELLVKAVDATHPDPAKDARGCYKRGDPVAVKPDGHAWGALETLPRFWVVKVPGATVAQLEQYVAALTNPDGSTNRRREWGVDTAKMPGGVRNTLQNTGTVTVTLAQVQTYLTRKGLL